MTGLLEQVLRRVEALPAEEQDVIAAQILVALDEDAAWERSLQGNPDELDRLAEEALAEHRRGETQPLDDLLNE